MYLAVFCTRLNSRINNLYIDCYNLRFPLSNFSEQMFTDWIKKQIKSAEILNQQYVFIVGGQCIYLTAFCALYGISTYKFHIIQNIINKPTVYKSKGRLFIHPWKTFLYCWFANLIDIFCDIMPNSDNQHLPVYFTKGTLYDTTVLEFQADQRFKFSLSSFREFWKENFKTVCIPKSLTMGICDACLELKTMKSRGKSGIDIAKMQVEHNKLHASARQYLMVLEPAQQQPFNILYLQFDGKQASYLPHIISLPKDTQNISRI
jgi:hypothetical protein